MTRRRTTEEFINEAKAVHGDKYGYDECVYTTANNKVKIYCIKCKEHFFQNAQSHLSGSGCSKCAINGRKKTREQFIADAKLVHGDKYDYSEVEYKNADEKVKIYCKSCKEYFYQRASGHLKGEGCAKCAHKRINKKKTKTTKQFIKDAKKIHGDKYDYSKVIYEKYDKCVIIICLACNCEFLQTPTSHLSGYGCKVCGRKSMSDKNRKTAEDFIERSLLIHGDKYEYSKVVYHLNNEPVKIFCKKCQVEFEQTPSAYLLGSGCRKCGYEIQASKIRKTTEEFVEEAKNIHGNKFSYDKVDYKSYMENVIITCNECKNDFLRTPIVHLRSGTCPHCKPTGYSKIAIEWLNFIQHFENKKIQHAENEDEYAIPGSRYDADGYCAETNEIFEFYGDFFHGNPAIYTSDYINKLNYKSMGELYKNTMIRQRKIEKLGYEVRFIWESDWRHIRSIILSYLTRRNNKKRKLK